MVLIFQKLIDLYNAKDYGRYADKNGKMPLAFIATNHTTGGNSGSPALDAKGNLIGLNFDRVWEGTMSDIYYSPEICRNIMVDTRYILFVIDNSGSMMSTQQNVIKNSKIFMEQFAKQPYINWKIGMVSTDKAENPYIGFDNSYDWTLIDFRDPTSFDRTVKQFQDSVAQLETNGDASEYVFYNVKRVLDLYDGRSPARPRFLRSDSHLVVIMVIS